LVTFWRQKVTACRGKSGKAKEVPYTKWRSKAYLGFVCTMAMHKSPVLLAPCRAGSSKPPLCLHQSKCEAQNHRFIFTKPNGEAQNDRLACIMAKHKTRLSAPTQ